MTAVGASLLPGRAIANVATDAQDCNQLLDPARAVAGCTRLLKSTGDKSKRNLAIIYQNRGNARGNAGDRDGAIADFSEAIRLNPECGLCYAGRALVWHNKFDYEKAYADFDRALQSQPANPRIYYMRGSVLRDNGEYDRALADAELAIRIARQGFLLYALRSGIFFDKHDLDRAMADINEAIRLNPRVYMNYNFRGLFWRDKGDYDRAIADFTEAIRLNPGYWTSYANRGEAWRMKGDLERALSDQNRAVQIDPQSATSYVTRDDTYRYRDELEPCARRLRPSAQPQPDYIPAYIGRGRTYEKIADLSRARDEFKRRWPRRASSRRRRRIRHRDSACAARGARVRSGATGDPGGASEGDFRTRSRRGWWRCGAGARGRCARGRRIALVIGNSAYRSACVDNPQHDAEVMAAALRAIGFDPVALVEDATRDTMIGRCAPFAASRRKGRLGGGLLRRPWHRDRRRQLSHSGRCQARRRPRRQIEAVPLEQCWRRRRRAEAHARRARRLPRQSVRAACIGRRRPKSVARAIDRQHGGGDAPVDRGLGRDPGAGATLVVYATKHGQTALDGDGADSPFAIAVVQRIATPNVEINKLFRLVRDDVMEAPGRSPTPTAHCRAARISSS